MPDLLGLCCNLDVVRTDIAPFKHRDTFLPNTAAHRASRNCESGEQRRRAFAALRRIQRLTLQPCVQAHVTRQYESGEEAHSALPRLRLLDGLPDHNPPQAHTYAVIARLLEKRAKGEEEDPTLDQSFI